MTPSEGHVRVAAAIGVKVMTLRRCKTLVERCGGNELAPRLHHLVDELRKLIELVEKLPASPERAATVRDLIGHRDRLNAIIEQGRVTLH